MGLIVSGRLSNSLLLRRPALARHIGPVVAPDRRLATRYSNSLRAGSAAPVEDLHACGLVLVHAAGGLEKLLPLLIGAGPWKGVHFALLSADLEASALAAVRQTGAKVCSVAPAPARGRDLVVVEGDAWASRRARQWLNEGHIRCLELPAGRKALFLLGLQAATSLLAPLLDASLMALRASGLGATEARRLLHDAAEGTVRAFAARGRRAGEKLGAPCPEMLELQLAEAARREPRIAHFFHLLLEAAGAFYAPPPAAPAGQDSRVPGRAAGIT